MKTYKEWMDYQLKAMSAGRKLLFYMGPPDWSGHYYRYALQHIAKSESLVEAIEKTAIALGDSEKDKAARSLDRSRVYANSYNHMSPEFRKFRISLRSR